MSHPDLNSCLQFLTEFRWKVVAPTITFLVMLPFQINGQQTREANLPSVINLSPRHTFFFSVSNERASSGTIVQLRRRQVRDNIDIPLDRLRFLAVEQVREELKLSQESVGKLQPLLELLTQFEHQDKWNYFFQVKSVSRIAAANVKAFVEKLVEAEKQELLTQVQLQRLDQLRLQFNCLGLEMDLPNKSPLYSVKRQLNLTKEQNDAIREIIESELGAVLSIQAQFEGIKELLTENQRGDIDSVFTPFYELDTPMGLSLAQCYDRLNYDKLEKDASPAFDLALVEGTVLTLSGRLAIESVYLEGSEDIFVVKPWRRILDQILRGSIAWLRLDELQMNELRQLKTIKRGADGGNVVVYYGTESYAKLSDAPNEFSSPRTNEDWWKLRKEIMNEADEKMGAKIQSILLPFQIDAIKTGLAAGRTLELGPYYIFINNLCEAVEITNDQKTKLLELRDDRHDKLVSIFEKIDKLSRSELTQDQVAWVEHNLGDYCTIYPCFWLFVVN